MEPQNNIGALFARIAKIAGEVGAVGKSGKLDSGQGQGYKYHSADDVMGHLNKLMSEHGLVIIPNVVDTTIVKGADEIERWLITYEYIIGDADGNTMTARWTGEAPMYGRRKDGGLFTDDKSLGKAHTYSYKYYLLKLFMVSTVDVDDLDTNVVDKGNQGNSKQVPKNSPAKQDKLDPAAHGLGTKEIDIAFLKELTAPLYDNVPHQDNSIAKLIKDGVLKNDMNVDTAAAYVFMHRAGGKELGFNDADVKLALGMTLGEFLKRNPRNYTKAWQMCFEHMRSLEMPE